MYCDKKRIYIFTLLLSSILFLSFFIPINLRRIIVATIIAIFAIICFYRIKKRSILSISKKQVFYIMLVIGLLYLMISYLMGLKFGFYKNSSAGLNNKYLMYILPISVLIIGFEYIRRVLIAQKIKIINILSYVCGILVDLIIFVTYSRIMKFDHLMDVVGMWVLPSITFNLLYTYVSSKYGMWPNVIFRLIISLYLYIIPVVPKTEDILVVFIKLLLPLIIYLFLKVLYTKQRKIVNPHKKGLSIACFCIGVIMMSGLVMLISCQFKYGALVIGSESMTGAINKGDAIVYEQFDDQVISVGDVIVFEKNNQTIVHRVVDIAKINNEVRYFTKGDANEDQDTGYVVSSQIKGITQFRIIYIGYPTIWVRSLFK